MFALLHMWTNNGDISTKKHILNKFSKYVRSVCAFFLYFLPPYFAFKILIIVFDKQIVIPIQILVFRTWIFNLHWKLSGYIFSRMLHSATARLSTSQRHKFHTSGAYIHKYCWTQNTHNQSHTVQSSSYSVLYVKYDHSWYTESDGICLLFYILFGSVWLLLCCASCNFIRVFVLLWTKYTCAHAYIKK